MPRLKKKSQLERDVLVASKKNSVNFTNFPILSSLATNFKFKLFVGFLVEKL